MNILLFNDKKYFFESYWSKYKKKKDSEGNLFPEISDRVLSWNKGSFIKKLKLVEKTSKKELYEENSIHNKCFLCSYREKCCVYTANNTKWESILKHYIMIHSVRPSAEFMDFIFRYDVPPQNSLNRNSKNSRQTGRNIYLKIKKNQINILDALMEHGGNQYYHDKSNKKIFRYSEHAGILHFDKTNLNKIIVFGNTSRVDDADTDIYLPENNQETLQYEYFFHTHPPTPSPGGRWKSGILYEFPSISDIFHYIDHNNYGKAKGSIVIAAEGMYIIRKYEDKIKKIKINEDELYETFIDLAEECQEDAIKKYTPFTTKKFYKVIGQDLSYINKINTLLKNYNLWVDFFPRTEDSNGNWYIDSVHLLA